MFRWTQAKKAQEELYIDLVLLNNGTDLTPIAAVDALFSL
jgi:hypothetical protein